MGVEGMRRIKSAERNAKNYEEDSRISIYLDDVVRYHDCGGGYRTTRGEIYIDSSLPQRMKRKIALYESLGSLLEYSLTHEQIEDISDVLLSVLDQIEPCEAVICSPKSDPIDNATFPDEEGIIHSP
jgi:hypothetical protein